MPTADTKAKAVRGMLVTHAVLEIDTDKGPAIIGFPRGSRVILRTDESLPDLVTDQDIAEIGYILEHLR